MDENEKEIMRAASEIIKGMASNPNIKIIFQNNNLYFELDDDGLITKFETVYAKVVAGIKNGMD